MNTIETSALAAWSGLALALAFMAAIWGASIRRRDASLVDRFWGAGFVLLALWYAATAPMPGGAGRALLLVLVAIWGGRLSLYLTWRNWGHGEDYRYQEMRARAGSDRAFAWRSLVTVFVLQGVIMWFVSLSLMVALRGPFLLTNPVAMLGLLLWAVGFYFEAAGDLELARFKAVPANRGRVLDTGVWRYTRHPNYFGDACLWWGFFCFAVAAGSWWTVLSPLLMTGLLLKVSGVALLEKKLVDTKPQYRDYIARTSAFIPWPPRVGPGPGR